MAHSRFVKKIQKFFLIDFLLKKTVWDQIMGTDKPFLEFCKNKNNVDPAKDD